MSVTKTLMLAGFAVLSLGGAAMADGSGVATNEYWAAQYRAEANKAATNVNRGAISNPADVRQSGASDLERSHPAFHIDTNLTAGGGG